MTQDGSLQPVGYPLFCIVERSWGISPVSSENWNNLDSAGANSDDAAWSIFVGIWSDPAALFTFRFFCSLYTPFSVMFMSGMLLKLLGPLFGIGPSSSLVKTDVNWSFRMLALLWLSLFKKPCLFFNGATPTYSCFCSSRMTRIFSVSQWNWDWCHSYTPDGLFLSPTVIVSGGICIYPYPFSSLFSLLFVCLFLLLISFLISVFIHGCVNLVAVILLGTCLLVIRTMGV